MIDDRLRPFPAVISVDVDGDLPLRASTEPGVPRPRAASAGRYGPEVGAYRLLRVFRRLGIHADWFVPGQLACEYPELIDTLCTEEQPIGVHGDQHLDFDGLTLTQQIEEMLLGKERLRERTGTEAAGFRVPSGEWKPGFISAMAESGFQWSSSLAGAEKAFPLEYGVVEVPVRYELEDLQYFGFSMDPPFPPGQSRIALPEAVERNWRMEAEGAARFGTLFHLRLNAEVIGTPGRTRMLERFLRWLIDETAADVITCVEAAMRASECPPERNLYRSFLELRESEARDS